MQIGNESIFNDASKSLRRLYGNSAKFRDGQYEAIEATLLNKRTLVVQRTGWGKSLVYFISTLLLRQNQKGITIVVSPLLVLMQNQLEAANRLELRCEVLNSSVNDRRDEILNAVKDDRLDLLFITPENLFKRDVQEIISRIAIGLFVIDEAHCISDWGHDFRLEYGRLSQIIQKISVNVPVLATTATANNRVVADLKMQMGNQVFISRGALMRESLSIQILRMPDKASRYAWILQNILKLPGSGIIYCLTQRDCDYLTDFLVLNGIKAISYYSRQSDDSINIQAEELFRKNEIKAIVATIKLGMGYDKPDIAFVIHYQQPGNIVSYYQQIGRAGRSIPRAYTFLMTGTEDNDIHEYFINTAFPTREAAMSVYRFIQSGGHTPPRITEILAGLNLKTNRIQKALMFLESEELIYKDDGKYYVTANPFYYDQEHYKNVTEVRERERMQMQKLTTVDTCYNRYVVNALDDPTEECCGICGNCLGYEEFSSEVDDLYLERAHRYLQSLIIPIEPRKKWPNTSFTGKGMIIHPNLQGLCLSRYGDPGYGAMVKKEKYEGRSCFSDQLLGKSVEVIRPIVTQNAISAVTCVPSLNNKRVDDFARKLAGNLGLPYYELIEKINARPQKSMENSFHQCSNAFYSFRLYQNRDIPQSVLLIDDIVDSRWTLTVCGYLLTNAGCISVSPFALADSSQGEK